MMKTSVWDGESGDPRCRVKAIHRPSGDHAGARSWSGPEVRTTSPVPSALMTWMWKRPSRRLANTIRPFDSGVFRWAEPAEVTGCAWDALGASRVEWPRANNTKPADAATATPGTATASDHRSRRW